MLAAKPNLKSTSTATPAPAAQAEMDSFLTQWNQEIKGDEPPETAWRRPRSASPSPPLPRRPPSPDIDLLTATRKREVELARTRLVIPSSLRRLLGSPSTARAFLSHPSFTRADLCSLARVASPFLRPVQRILFARLVIKTPAQLAGLGSVSEELLKEIGSVTIALGDLRAQAGEMPLLRATMDSICDAEAAMEGQDMVGEDQEDEDGFEPTAQEIVDRKRQRAYRMALELLDDRDAVELATAIRIAYDDVPYSSIRVGGGQNIGIEAISAEALSRSLLNKLEDVVIVFPASSLAKDLLPVLSKTLSSLEIIHPLDASQSLPPPIDITLYGGSGQLPLAREGVTAIHRLPFLSTLTLEGVTLVPNELSGFGVTFDRAAPYDLTEISLTRITYESGGSLEDLHDNLESNRAVFGPYPPSHLESPPPLVSADDGGSTQSPWIGSYPPEQRRSTYSSWLDRSSWTDKVKDETIDQQDAWDAAEPADSSPSSKLDLHLFVGAGSNTLRILKLDTVSAFEDESIIRAVEANAESLEELVVVEEAELDILRGSWEQDPRGGRQGAPDLVETTFSIDEDDFGDEGVGDEGLGEAEMEQSQSAEASNEAEQDGGGGEHLDSSFLNLALDTSASTADASPSATAPHDNSLSSSTALSTITLSPFAAALAGCSSLLHLRLSNRPGTLSTYPADIVDVLLLANPALTMLELRLATPQLAGDALQEWRRGWGQKVKRVLESVDEFGVARITLVEEVA